MGAAAATVVTLLAFSGGGYLVAGHGLFVLAFAVVVLVAALVQDEVRLDRRAVALVGGLSGLVLWALASVAWSAAVAWPVLEAQRGVLYVMGVAALLLVVTPARVTSLAAGVTAGATAVSLYALTTRLFPGRAGRYEPEAGYQLAAPIGYWNALGLLLVFGILLGAGLALRGPARLRVPAGMALVPVAVALYFTFSRGAVLALLVGLLVLIALDRSALVGLSLIALAPAGGVILASRFPALTRAGESLPSAQAQGQRLAVIIGLLVCVAAVSTWVAPTVQRRAETRLRLPSGRRVAVVMAFALVTAVAVVGLARVGGPAAVATRAIDAFSGEPPVVTGSLDRRLFSASGHGRADYWRVAAGMVASAPALGEGAGSFERRWIEDRPAPNNARDAHNLYLETLAELGPVGLILLLVALGAPLTGLGRARRRSLVPAAAAAYAAFLAHASVDWDWELPVLVLPALACAVILTVEARTMASVQLAATGRAIGVTVAAGALALALPTYVGTSAVADGFDALERADTAAAVAAAHRAKVWLPWSHEPLQLLGEAQLARGEDTAARGNLRQAIRRAPEEWRLWFDLAIVSEGAEARRAITRARELNPVGDEISDLDGRWDD